jgi:hypothetical protein
MADRLDIQLISAALRRMGWVRFWAQVVLAVVLQVVLAQDVAVHLWEVVEHLLPVVQRVTIVRDAVQVEQPEH